MKKTVTTYSLLLAGLVFSAQAQTPIYQWNFNGSGSGTGTPSITAGGGTLIATSPGDFSGTGVGGGVNNFAYNNGTGSSGSTISAGDVSGLGTLSQFTFTMWINSSTLFASQPQSAARIFMIGDLSSYDEAGTSPASLNATHPGFSLALNSGTGLQLGVGSSITSVAGGLLTSYAANQWVFVAVEYDGTSSAFSSPSLGTAIGNNTRNAAILLGTDTTTLGAPNMLAITTDFSTSPGSIAFSSSSVALVGNRTSGGRGFKGSMDNIEIYNGLLTTSQLDSIRLAAITPVPEPNSAVVIGLGGLATLAMFRRRRQ